MHFTHNYVPCVILTSHMENNNDGLDGFLSGYFTARQVCKIANCAAPGNHHRLASQNTALHSPQSRAQFCSYKYRVLSSAGRFRSQTAGAGRCNCFVILILNIKPPLPHSFPVPALGPCNGVCSLTLQCPQLSSYFLFLGSSESCQLKMT